MNVLTCMYLSHTGQNKVDALQNKVDMLQESVIKLDNKIDTFQNETEASTGKHHHEVVELLQNINCSLDSKTLPHFQAPTLQISGGAWYIYEVHDIKLTAAFNRCPTHLSAL